MMKVNLCVRKPKEYLNYVPFNSISIAPPVNFQLEVVEEVNKLPKLKKKQYRKIAASFLMTLASIIPFGSKSMASTLQQSQLNPVATTVTSLPTSQVGIPAELASFLSGGLVTMVAVAVVLCIGMLIAAGVLRALRKRKEASEWTVDIVKGLTQIILSAPLVFLIYFVATMLFSGSGWFISPFAIK